MRRSPRVQGVGLVSPDFPLARLESLPWDKVPGTPGAPLGPQDSGCCSSPRKVKQTRAVAASLGSFLPGL